MRWGALTPATVGAPPGPRRAGFPPRGHLQLQSKAGASLADAAGPGCLPGLQGQPGADAAVPQCHGGGGPLLLRAAAARLRPAGLCGRERLAGDPPGGTGRGGWPLSCRRRGSSRPAGVPADMGMLPGRLVAPGPSSCAGPGSWCPSSRYRVLACSGLGQQCRDHPWALPGSWTSHGHCLGISVQRMRHSGSKPVVSVPVSHIDGWVWRGEDMGRGSGPELPLGVKTQILEGKGGCAGSGVPCLGPWGGRVVCTHAPSTLSQPPEGG